MNKYNDKSRWELLEIINQKDSLPVTPAKSLDSLTDREILTWLLLIEQIEEERQSG